MIEQNKQPTIIFDIGGVLVDWNPKHLYRKMFDGDEAKVNQFLTTVCPFEWNAKVDAGYPFAKAIEERAALFPEYEAEIRAYLDRWEEMIGGDFPGTVEIVAALREQGYPLYLLSNWFVETYPLIYNRFEFLHWFEDVILSGDVKVAKPDPAIYHATLERVQREAGDCLFIDDSEKNIRAARELGFQTILFTSSEQLHAELSGQGLI
jgi:2-haloacid dehalogenase